MNFLGALRYILMAVLQLYIFVFVIRFLMQWARADFRNPLSQAIVQISNPLVMPLRKVIPGWGGLDMATLASILILEILGMTILAAFTFGNPLILGVPRILGHASLHMLHTFLNVILLLVFVRVILSWVSPGAYNPMTAVINSITEPLMAPVRRIIPPISGLDLSALVILIGISALKVLIPVRFAFM